MAAIGAIPGQPAPDESPALPASELPDSVPASAASAASTDASLDALPASTGPGCPAANARKTSPGRVQTVDVLPQTVLHVGPRSAANGDVALETCPSEAIAHAWTPRMKVSLSVDTNPSHPVPPAVSTVHPCDASVAQAVPAKTIGQ
jgi:hypothetical protein